MVKVIFHFPAMIGNNVPKEILIDSNVKTVEDVIALFHENFGIPRTRYDRNLDKDISVFRGQVLIKNDKLIGHFTDDGYKPQVSDEQRVKPEDIIEILFVVAGG